MYKILNFKDNSNKKANIGFICEYPFYYYIYNNIYKYLPNSEFILTNENYSPSKYYDKKLLQMIDFFSKKNVCWSVFDNRNKDPVKFFSKYEILVGSLYRGCIRREYNKHKKKVRVLYGPGKDLVDFGIGNCYFDLILTYGKYSQKYLKLYTKTKMVGYPKFDDWFSDNIDEKDLNDLKRKINPRKKTILYVPTYGYLSSISNFGNKVLELSSDFNLIIKFHHISLWDEKEKIKKFFNNKKIITFNKEKDIIPLLSISDVVISDNSGVIFEAVLTDKPIILLGKFNDEFLKNIKSVKVKRKFLQPALTYIDSIEQKIRRPGKEIGIIVEDSDDIKKAVINSLKSNSLITKKRRFLRDKLFSFNDGKAGFRAAEEIKNLLIKPRPKEKFLAIAIKSYIFNLKDNLKYGPKNKI